MSFSYIFFRAENLAHAFSYINGIFSESILAIPSYNNSTLSLLTLSVTIVFIVIEWIGRNCVDKSGDDNNIDDDDCRHDATVERDSDTCDAKHVDHGHVVKDLVC